MVKTEYCPQCDGFGWIPRGTSTFNMDCPLCNATGKVAKPPKVYPLPDHSVMVTHLVTHFNTAGKRDIEQGIHWYDAARTVAEALAAGTGYTVEQTASVIAVLSPNVVWDENVNSALLAVEGHYNGVHHSLWRGAGYGENKAKAADILNGDLTRLRGPKVTQFAKGILGDNSACTIDLWMLRSIDVDDKLNVTPTRWKRIHAAIEEAATVCGYDVCTFQAIVWSKVRNETLAKNSKHAWRVV